MCPTFIFGKKFIPKFVPIFVKKILLRVAIDIGKKVILKFVPIFGKKFLLKALLDIVTIMYPTLLFGKKFILKIVPMFGEKILLKVVLDIVTIEHVEYPTFISFIYIYFYSEITANLLILNVFVFAKKILLKLYFVSCYCHGVFYFSKNVILFSV